AGTDSSGVNEVIVFVVADKKRAEPDSFALWICKTTDEEILGQLTLHLQPFFRSSMFVDRSASLRDHAFPAFSLRTLPRRWIFDKNHSMKRLLKWHLGQQLTTFLDWQCGHVATVNPHDVKHVILDLATRPRDLAVKYQLVMG